MIATYVAGWQSAWYAFFEMPPKIKRQKNKAGQMATYHVFNCLKCRKPLNRNVNDSGSTGALGRHVEKCWGDETAKAVKNVTLAKAREIVKTHGSLRNSKLTHFLCRAKSAVESFGLAPPRKAEIRYVRV